MSSAVLVFGRFYFDPVNHFKVTDYSILYILCLNGVLKNEIFQVLLGTLYMYILYFYNQNYYKKV